MQRRFAVTMTLAMLAGGLIAMVPAATASPTGPVTNSDFEIPPVPDSASAALDDTPLNDCYGVGHQVLFGSNTTQAEALGGSADGWGVPSVNPDQAQPVEAATGAAEDPEGTANQQTDCVWGDETGYDVAWLQPKDRTTQPFHWSTDVRNPAADFGYNFDDDPFDREVKILADGDASSHNMGQWFGSKHQAWTPNADALEMDIEAGDIPSKAQVTLVLTVGPNPDGNHYNDCQLHFDADLLGTALAEGEDGHLAASPTDARLTAANDACTDKVDDWQATEDEDERREILSDTRITQLSFWRWNQADQPTVIDDVQITGAQTAAGAAAGVNAPLN